MAVEERSIPLQRKERVSCRIFLTDETSGFPQAELVSYDVADSHHVLGLVTFRIIRVRVFRVLYGPIDNDLHDVGFTVDEKGSPHFRQWINACSHELLSNGQPTKL